MLFFTNKPNLKETTYMFVTTAALVTSVLLGVQDPQIEALTDLVHELRSEVSELKNKQSKSWISAQRADEVRELVSDILADADTRSNLQGSAALAGYDGGAFLKSTDGNWSLKINGQLQSRWLYNKADTQTSQHGFEMRRTKITFSGHVVDPSWTYKISPTWNRAGGSNTLDAYIQKKFDDGSWFKFGQFKANFLRENIVSSSKQLTVERSMLDNAFTYGWTQGVELGWQNDDVKIVAQYTDGPNQSNTIALQDPVNAWIVRAEFRFGDAGWKDFNYLTSKMGADRGLLIGVAYQNFDNNASTAVDGAGNPTSIEYGNADAFKSDGWTVDASWRGDGWNLFGYYVTSDGENFANTLEQQSDGWLVQAAFMVNANTELFGQYQEGNIDSATWANGSNDMDAFRVGFNYWPVSGNNAVKWTTDVAWAGKSLAAGGAGASTSGIAVADWDNTGNGWRGDQGTNDNQMLLRTQLQLLF
tara:strand:- start:81 stop:1502 length:1422 start_codon:yes stop_codon:yes gene_type:complete